MTVSRSNQSDDYSPGPFQLEDWLIEPESGRISRDNQSVHLEPKVMALLVTMAQSPEHVHRRDELLESVWAGTIVSDEALTNAIIKLRKALQDDARHPRYIETLSKRGYRLVASVRWLDEGATDQADSAIPTINHSISSTKPILSKPLTILLSMVFLGALVSIVLTIQPGSTPPEPTPHQSSLATEPAGLPLPNKPSIAVLPFINIGNEITDSYFSDGITDDLITDLSKLSGLFVISRNSSFKYKDHGVDVREVSKSLGVRYILEGTVRRSGERVRVNTQLIDGLSGGQLWAERYDGQMKDVFSLQDRMTEKIISALSLKLSPQEKVQLSKPDTASAEAYDEFLKGWELRWRVNPESFARAEQHFKKALELDPEYARAHAGLALLYMQDWQQDSGSPSARWERAQAHLEAAMSNPDSLTHSLRSTLELHNGRHDKAISEARQAVALNPGSAESHLVLAEALSYSGEHMEAIFNVEKAQRLDPNLPGSYLVVEGRALFDRMAYHGAVRTLDKALQAMPDDTETLIYQIAAYGQLGQTDYAGVALNQLNNLLKSDNLPRFTLSVLRNQLPYKSPEAFQHLRDGLIKGGVPE